MARYYRKRSYTRVVRPKKKWATNIVNLFNNDATFGTDGTFIIPKLIASNKKEDTAPSPVIIKTGNFKVQFDLTVNVGAAGVVAATAYIIFIPEGYVTDTASVTAAQWSTIIESHPEWLLLWRELDLSNANAAGSVDTSIIRASSRLKRNLNSGDKIYFVLLGSGDFTGVQTRASLRGACQYWTCAN